MKIRTLLGSLLLVCNSSFALALSPDVAVREGMTLGEVVTTLGKPQSRQHFETKREELWIYDSVEIRFRNGKVAKWEARPGSELYQRIEAAKEAEERAAEQPDVEDSGMVEAIFNEIMQEVPDKGPATP